MKEPPGWWLDAVVVLQNNRDIWPLWLDTKEDSELDFHGYDSFSRAPSAGRRVKPKTSKFIVDSGAVDTYLGTEAIRQFHLTTKNTKETGESSILANGSKCLCYGANGMLYIPHLPPLIFGKEAYSVFKVVFRIFESDLEAVSKGDEERTESLLGQDVLDFLLTYGGVRKRRPGKDPTPLDFLIRPNWRSGTITPNEPYEYWSPRRFPHDATKFARRRRALTQNRNVRTRAS